VVSQLKAGLKSLRTKFISASIVIIGGGAAGFFCAINCALLKKDAKIILLEKSNKLLSKVRISGGGRCNVTNARIDLNDLAKYYPRGYRELKQVFTQFTNTDTVEWFRSNGVVLKSEEDGRMFPVSDSSETIINCFLKLCNDLNITIITDAQVQKLEKNKEQFLVCTTQGNYQASSVVCALGGHPKSTAYLPVTNLGHTLSQPIPSLFTFNLPANPITKELQGLSVENAEVSIKDTKLKWSGPLLVTHWGLSGPAVLKLSAFGAQQLYDKNYQAQVKVNWLNSKTEEDVFQELKASQKNNHRMLLKNGPTSGLPRRLWEYLVFEVQISDVQIWAEVTDKALRKLAHVICNSEFEMQGKTTFKEEFVTSGGIELKEIDFKRMESKLVPGLYFCGECINIDGITGGFNFQNAWSTAFVAAKAICT
jgi:predicted Rossmann fold flavoprotein